MECPPLRGRSVLHASLAGFALRRRTSLVCGGVFPLIPHRYPAVLFIL